MSRWVSYSTGGNFSISNSYLRMPTITNICSYTNNSNLVITKNTNIISGLVSNINSSFKRTPVFFRGDKSTKTFLICKLFRKKIKLFFLTLYK